MQFQKFVALETDIRIPTQEDSLSPIFHSLQEVSPPSNPSWVKDRYFSGEFDLLGSGWISRRSNCDVSINQRAIHRRYTRVLQSMISPDYQMLDWQLDPVSHKSGNVANFWSDNTALIGVLKGFDIKQPWELGRMQFLPEMAMWGVQNLFPKQELWRFFKNTVLDFYASNPYDLGCQWGCSMDVAIRSVNLLVAYNLFLICGIEPDNEFRRIFSRLIYLHGKHISSNLEKQLNFSTNHYFADICGLAFIGAALHQTQTGKNWLSFASQEFRNELKIQFLADGGNFESSSTYHVQVGEMVTFTLALLIGSGETETWPNNELQNVLSLLARMRKLALTLVAPDGNIVQIGDNDSGIFLHLAPVREFDPTGVLIENRLNISGFIAASSSLLGSEISQGEKPADAVLVRALLGGRANKFATENDLVAPSPSRNVMEGQELPKLPYHVEKIVQVPKTEPSEWNLEFFPDFGLAVWKSPRIWLSLFWGGPGQHGSGGHSHNDKLSMILFIDGKPIWNDPGSFCYTGDPERRNLYRSVHSHPMAVSISDPDNEFKGCGAFTFPKKISVKIGEISTTGIALLLEGEHQKYVRRVRLAPSGEIKIETWSSGPIDLDYTRIPFSCNYGRIGYPA